jgi:hypothetical protein
MIVYRYLTEQFGLLALQQQKWKIGRLLELNDPLDCQPMLSRVGRPEDVSVDADPYFREIYDSIGIICYSASIDDPVIWSHYADSHRGMAFGFEFPPGGDALLEVNYPEDDARARLDQDILDTLKRTNDQAALVKVISNGFTKKAKSWKYECEYRHFIMLHECEMIGPHYFRAMPLPDLRQVVLGVKSRVTESDISRIRNGWQTRHPFEIKKAQMDPQTYRLRT